MKPATRTSSLIEQNNFKSFVAETLGLPEDWEKYLRIVFRSDYTILQSKDNYNATIFRKFKHSSDATFPADLSERVISYCSDKKKEQKQREADNKEREYFQELLKDVMFSDENFYLYYHYRVGLILQKRSNRDTVQIKHDGEITEPSFCIKDTMTIAQLESFLEKSKAIRAELLQKAIKIKNGLPKEFFKHQEYIIAAKESESYKIELV